MPKWPFKWPFKEPSDPAEKAFHRIEEVRRNGKWQLDLSDFKLSTLPKAIGQLTQLQMLNLSSNQLSTLPEAIGQLTKLQTLHLSSNQLSALPEAVCQLTKRLLTLHLADNQLRTLPEAIGQLTQIRELDLSGNQLSALAETVQRLEKLDKLLLHGNPGLGLPDEVLGPTSGEVYGSQKRSPKPPREILDYYFATRGAMGRALREVKLIVLGRGGAGKTSLVKRLKGELFDLHEGETHGINIRELELACADGPVQGRVWDFGGQHVLHAMHEFSSPRAVSTCWCSASATTWPSATPPTGSSSFAVMPDRRRWSWR
jgi:internalin A